MILIKNLPTRIIKSYVQSFGLFLCPYCSQEIEKRLSDGKKCKSCDCVQYKLSSISLKGHIVNNETRQKQKLANEGRIVSNETRQKISNKTKGGKLTINAIKNISKAKQGIKNPMYGKSMELSPTWQGGKSFEIYPQEFKKIKKKIYERDNYQCQFPYCIEIHNKLNAHHIDYNKKNNNPENLITLCINCHMKTNFNRDYYTVFFQNIMLNKKVS